MSLHHGLSVFLSFHVEPQPSYPHVSLTIPTYRPFTSIRLLRTNLLAKRPEPSVPSSASRPTVAREGVVLRTLWLAANILRAWYDTDKTWSDEKVIRVLRQH
jgi:hypothetical protein